VEWVGEIRAELQRAAFGVARGGRGNSDLPALSRVVQQTRLPLRPPREEVRHRRANQTSPAE